MKIIPLKSKTLDGKIKEFNERARKEGTLMSDEEWNRLWGNASESYEVGNFLKRSQEKKSKK